MKSVDFVIVISLLSHLRDNKLTISQVESSADSRGWVYRDIRLSIYNDVVIGADLWLRPTFPEDKSILAKIYSDKDYVKYFGSVSKSSNGEIDSELNSRIKWNLHHHNARKDGGRWSVLSHDGVIGMVGSSPHQYRPRTEIWRCIDKSQSGRGFATQVGKLVMEYLGGAFIATVHPDNHASSASLMKLGFYKDLERQNVFIEKYQQPRNYYLHD